MICIRLLICIYHPDDSIPGRQPIVYLDFQVPQLIRSFHQRRFYDQTYSYIFGCLDVSRIRNELALVSVGGEFP
jgi:hypothetical protein